MNILYFDGLFPIGHKKINNYYLNLISENKDNNIIVAAPLGWFDVSTNVYDEKWYTPQKGTRFSRIKHIKNIWKLVKLCKRVKPDVIYFASYDILSFFISMFMLGSLKTRIILQEHNNIDQLTNKIKKFIYKLYMNDFVHCVFEEAFRDYLNEIGIEKNNIFVIPHPCEHRGDSLRKNNRNCVAISGSNDERLISELICLESEKKVLEKSNTRIVVKSKKQQFISENLRVINGWIKDSELDNIYNESDYVLLLFPKSYSYRVSAVFMEAISRGKYVVANRFPLVVKYRAKYSGICSVFDNVNDISTCLGGFSAKEYENDRIRFLRDHSKDRISEAWNEVLSIFV